MDKTENEETKRVDVGNRNSESIVSVSQQKQVRPFYLIDRELEILEFIHDMKFATNHEIFKKFYYNTRPGFFAKSDRYARYRIQELTRNGYLKVGRVDEKHTNFYIITTKALKLLNEKYPAKILGNIQRNIDIRCFEHDKLVLAIRMYLESEKRSIKWVSDKRLKCHTKVQRIIGAEYLPDALSVDNENTKWAIEIEISPKARWIYQDKIKHYVDLMRDEQGTGASDRLIDKVLYICVRPKVYEFLKKECEIYGDLIEVKTQAEFFGFSEANGDL